MLGWPLRCRFDSLVPTSDAASDDSPLVSSANTNVRQKQILQRKYYNGKRQINFKIGDNVLVKSFYKNGTKHTWLEGTILDTVGAAMFRVYIPSLQVTARKHVDQLLMYKGRRVSPDPGYNGDVTVMQQGVPGEGVPAEDSPELPSATREEDEQSDDSYSSLPSPTSSPRAAVHASTPTPDDPSPTGVPAVVDNNEPIVSNAFTRRFPLRSTRNPNPDY